MNNKDHLDNENERSKTTHDARHGDDQHRLGTGVRCAERAHLSLTDQRISPCRWPRWINAWSRPTPVFGELHGAHERGDLRMAVRLDFRDPRVRRAVATEPRLQGARMIGRGKFARVGS